MKAAPHARRSRSIRAQALRCLRAFRGESRRKHDEDDHGSRQTLEAGRPRGSAEYRVDFVPKARIDIAVDDGVVDPVVEAIANVARTGKVGDGKIFIAPLEQAIRIRTGETGASAT